MLLGHVAEFANLFVGRAAALFQVGGGVIVGRSLAEIDLRQLQVGDLVVRIIADHVIEQLESGVGSAGSFGGLIYLLHHRVRVGEERFALVRPRQQHRGADALLVGGDGVGVFLVGQLLIADFFDDWNRVG